jgi:hypothetical protein
MNSMEEKLWDYIDGNCTIEEQKAIGSLIANDEAFRLKYQELLSLNKEFSSIELEEPPMAFAYNVMEAVRAEHAQEPLKAAINRRIIIGITVFFLVTISALLVYTLGNISWASVTVASGGANGFKMPDLSHYIKKPLVEGFFFFDVILALFLCDTYLRRKKIPKDRQPIV